MRLAHVALASMLLVGVPMADAATCAGEEFSSSIEAGVVSKETVEILAVIASGDRDHESQLPGDAQHCIHGHCHHSTPITDGESIAELLMVCVSSVAPLGADTVLAHVSAGLERPPKT